MFLFILLLFCLILLPDTSPEMESSLQFREVIPALTASRHDIQCEHAMRVCVLEVDCEPRDRPRSGDGVCVILAGASREQTANAVVEAGEGAEKQTHPHCIHRHPFRTEHGVEREKLRRMAAGELNQMQGERDAGADTVG